MAKYRALLIAGIGAVAIGGIVIVATEVIRRLELDGGNLLVAGSTSNLLFP